MGFGLTDFRQYRFFTAIGGTAIYGLFFSIWPLVLIVGTLIQPHKHLLGRGLMASGALLLSVESYVLVIEIPAAFKKLPARHDFILLAIILFMLISIFLICWCDVELVINEFKAMRMKRSTR